jgi:hypothetical protein
MASTEASVQGSPLIFFFFITLGFLIFTLFSIQNAKSIDSIDKAKDGSTLTIIYVCILMIGSYFINTTISKALCNSQTIRWTDILLATLLPWIIIFFSLFIILKIFPGWVTPFSNTVGYLVISILGVETTLTNILNEQTDAQNDLAKAIANIKHNKSNFINQIDIHKTTFLEFIKALIAANIIKLNKSVAGLVREGVPERGSERRPKIGTESGTERRTEREPEPVIEGGRQRGARQRGGDDAEVKAEAKRDEPIGAERTKGLGARRPDSAIAAADPSNPENNPDITNLYKLLVIKNVIGQITWYTLAGILVSSVSENYIINMSCDKSLEEITADLNNAEIKSLEYVQKTK